MKLQSLSLVAEDVLVPLRDFQLMYPDVNFALLLSTNSYSPFSNLLEFNVWLKIVEDSSIWDCLGSWKEDVTDGQAWW